MALRLYSEYYDATQNGERWRVEISDTDFSGTALPFDMKSRSGAVVNWQGENTERYTPIVPTQGRFVMGITAAIEDFVTDLAVAAEQRFTVGVYRWDGSDFALWWCGLVLTDGCRLLDEADPTAFEVRAVDGLGILQKTDYSDTSVQPTGEPYQGRVRLVEHVFTILKKLDYVDTYWNGSSDFIVNMVAWQPDGLTFNPANDPWWWVDNDQRTWYNIDSQNKIKYRTCYEVLENILTAFGARLTQIEGRWRIDQPEVWRAATPVGRKYGWSVALPALVSMAGETQLGNAYPRALVNGTSFGYFPALKKVYLEYRQYNRRNLLAGLYFSYLSTGPSYVNDVHGDGTQTKLRFLASLFITVINQSYTGPSSDSLFYIFSLKIKLGNSWLKREISSNGFQIVRGNATWENYESSYELDTSFFQVPADGESLSFSTAVDVLSPVLIDSGDMEVSFDLTSVRNQQGDLIFLGDFDFLWSVHNDWLEVYDYGQPSLQINNTGYSVDNPDLGNSEILRLSTLIGDGTTPNTIGRLRRTNVFPPVDTTGWTYSGSSGVLGQLLAERIMLGQRLPVQKMYGRVIGGYLSPMNPVLYYGEKWIPLGVTYDTGLGQLEGEWFQSQEFDGTGVVVGAGEPSDDFHDFPLIAPPPVGGIKNGNGGTAGPDLAPATLYPLSAAELSTGFNTGGAVTSLPVNVTIGDAGFIEGETLFLVNPQNGLNATLTVTATAADGDTAIAVSGTLPGPFPSGSYVIKSPKNDLQFGSRARVYLHNDTISGGHAVTVPTSLVKFFRKENVRAIVRRQVYLPTVGATTRDFDVNLATNTITFRSALALNGQAVTVEITT